jgi:hypothetical protein
MPNAPILQTAAAVNDRADRATTHIFAAVSDHLRKCWESRNGMAAGGELHAACVNYLRDEFADVERQARYDLPPID